ncbi:MAG TPA: LysE family translocator [Flavobacteriales bacterium]|jgi:RhtB (resistance to homoserine/threonine) family protein|nr:LysE family translocator [Flavobacteriales bacterium]
MSYLSLIGLIFGIHLLAVMSPGPDFVMVLKNALQYNRKVAVYTALGISLGIGIHIIYSVAGIAYILKSNPKVFEIVKFMGAAYIIYMGYKTLQAKPVKMAMQTHQKQLIKPAEAIKIGFTTNVLNPKASLFFLSIFSLLIPPDVPLWVLLTISFMLIIVTFLWFAFVSVLATNPLIEKKYETYEPYILKTFGIILIGLGIAIFFE